MKINNVRVLIMAAIAVAIAEQAFALELNTGDILLFKGWGDGNAIFLLQRDEDYRRDLLLTYRYDYEPLYDMDHSRNRIYLGTQLGRDAYYVDLDSPAPIIKTVDFLPAGAVFSCAARDGSCLIIFKIVANDIYAEENPATAGYRKGNTSVPAILYKYSLGTGVSERITYFFSQWDAWLTPDAKYMAYRRYGAWNEPRGLPDCSWREAHYVFCKSDGTRKYDLNEFFLPYGPDLFWIFGDAGPTYFAPKPTKTIDSDNAFLIYVEIPRWWADKPYTDVFYYHTATLWYGDEGVNCNVEKKIIKIPPGIELYGLDPRYSDDKEIYLEGKDERGVRCLFLYDITTGELAKVPNTDYFDYFIVY
jgi:hypothetical protein